MVTGYEAGFYRDMTDLTRELDKNLQGVIDTMEHNNEILLSHERSVLIAAVFATGTPKDLDPIKRLQLAANAVDAFLKKEGV